MGAVVRKNWVRLLEKHWIGAVTSHCGWWIRDDHTGASTIDAWIATTSLGNPEKGSLPSKQEKVMAAESAPVGQNNPAESSFEGISAADVSKLNRPAMRAVYGEHSGYGSIHHSKSRI